MSSSIFGSCEKSGYREMDGHKRCNYCGSMDPVELAELIKESKAIMSGSDWKYGWPHKFYVDILNPNVGQIIQIGSKCYTDESGIRHDDPIMGEASKYLHAKFYSDHLTLIDQETFDKVAPIISEACGIKFAMDGEKGLMYSAPYHGYQKSSMTYT